MSDNRAETHDLKLPRPAKHSLPELAYEVILEAIVDGRFPPGLRVSIDELARQLDMSNTPIREALSRATAERLVVQMTNKGYMVAPMLSVEEYHQLFEVRHLLEVQALSLAEFQSEVADREAELVSSMTSLTHGPRYRDFKEFNRTDQEFHHNLVRMSKNVFLIKAWDNLHFHLHVGRLYTGMGVIDYSNALTEHSAIVEALQFQDKDQLIKCVSSHIRSAESRLSSLLQKKEILPK
jgi:DNA-binding GntR family transcriptional regulator